VEIVAEPDLSLFAFRLRAFGESDEDRDGMNRELLARINSGRRVFLTGTTLDTGFAIRFCVLSFRTDPARIDEAIDVIRNSVRERMLRR
jgi:glutamate/tyrosine decarboxylase-like PLP-dependent enzyme